MGHVAKMFALAEPPSKLANVKVKPKHKGPKHVGEEDKSTKAATKPKKPPTASQRILSEFSAG